MALQKSPKEIEIMREGGTLLSRALKAAVDLVGPGVAITDLDAAAEAVIREGGGEPSFKGYKSYPEDPAFPSTLCVSINEEVVHGTADRDIKLKEGDIVGLDVGCWYKGMCTDMAVTVPVGDISEEKQQLMRVTYDALQAGIAKLRVGGTIAEVSQAIEDTILPHGYGIVRALVGHGVGHKVHESPQIPNYTSSRAPHVEVLEGMCLAIEPMVALGGYEVETADDGWSIVMKDRQPSAHFEVTVAVTKEGVEILTPSPVERP